MDWLDVMLSRRSVREFAEEPLTDEELGRIFRAAMSAANSGGQQPWRFIVVDDPDLRDRLCTLDVERGGYYKSPQLIVVCGDIGSMKWKMHWLADCAAALQNLLLAAHGLDLGAVWQELYPYHKRVAAVRDMLGIPDTVYPMAVVSIGHPVNVPEPVDRYDPGKVMANRWGEAWPRSAGSLRNAPRHSAD